MFKIDISSLMVMSMAVSMFSEYFVHQHFFIKFEKYLMNTNLFWHKFFFCRFCMIGKLSMILAVFNRPVMFLLPVNYWTWTLCEWFINFLVINWLAVFLDGYLIKSLSCMFERQKNEIDMIIKDDKD